LFAEREKSEYTQAFPGQNPETLQFSHPNVEVLFVPSSTASVLQPMDQGVIKSFTIY
jgi:hypothetical protein